MIYLLLSEVKARLFQLAAALLLTLRLICTFGCALLVTTRLVCTVGYDLGNDQANYTDGSALLGYEQASLHNWLRSRCCFLTPPD